jgi:hypothetical protein
MAEAEAGVGANRRRFGDYDTSRRLPVSTS